MGPLYQSGKLEKGGGRVRKEGSILGKKGERGKEEGREEGRDGGVNIYVMQRERK